MMSFTSFEPEGSSSARQLYSVRRCGLVRFTCIDVSSLAGGMRTKYSAVAYCSYNCHPADEASGSKSVEDIKNRNISLENVHLLAYIL
jgi:hypothetical protein